MTERNKGYSLYTFIKNVYCCIILDFYFIGGVKEIVVLSACRLNPCLLVFTK